MMTTHPLLSAPVITAVSSAPLTYRCIDTTFVITADRFKTVPVVLPELSLEMRVMSLRSVSSALPAEEYTEKAEDVAFDVALARRSTERSPALTMVPRGSWYQVSPVVALKTAKLTREDDEPGSEM